MNTPHKSELQKILHRKEMYQYYTFHGLKGAFNHAVLDGDIMTIYATKENRLLHKFNIKTFEPVK
jgi:hypothetical protein